MPELTLQIVNNIKVIFLTYDFILCIVLRDYVKMELKYYDPLI